MIRLRDFVRVVARDRLQTGSPGPAHSSPSRRRGPCSARAAARRPRSPAVGRLDAGDAAVARRPGDRAAGLRAERARHMPHATAAAEPLELPPGVRSRFHGLRVTGGSKLANAVVTVLPMITAPACRSRSTTVASRRAKLFAHSFEPQPVGKSKTSMMSLTPIGMPCSGPRFCPAFSSAVSRSASLACAARGRRRPTRARVLVPVDAGEALLQQFDRRQFAAADDSAASVMVSGSGIVVPWSGDTLSGESYFRKAQVAMEQGEGRDPRRLRLHRRRADQDPAAPPARRDRRGHVATGRARRRPAPVAARPARPALRAVRRRRAQAKGVQVAFGCLPHGASMRRSRRCSTAACASST